MFQEHELLSISLTFELIHLLVFFVTVFGVSLEILVQRQKSTRPIPSIVIKCVDFLVLSGKTRVVLIGKLSCVVSAASSTRFSRICLMFSREVQGFWCTCRTECRIHIQKGWKSQSGRPAHRIS